MKSTTADALVQHADVHLVEEVVVQGQKLLLRPGTFAINTSVWTAELLDGRRVEGDASHLGAVIQQRRGDDVRCSRCGAATHSGDM